MTDNYVAAQSLFSWGPSTMTGNDFLATIAGVDTTAYPMNVYQTGQQNLAASPILSGTWSGGALTLPMMTFPPAAPIGGTAPTPTGPEFNVFLITSEPGTQSVDARTMDGATAVDAGDAHDACVTVRHLR